MIYTPSRNPKEAFTIISIMAAVGILGGIYISEYLMAIALVFWLQYTAVLSYLQFKRRKKHKYRGFTQYLLNPQIRFFIFEFLAVIGIGTLIIYNDPSIGTVALLAWWLFSLNFFFYYKDFKKYGE
jgi:hypothetical protein